MAVAFTSPASAEEEAAPAAPLATIVVQKVSIGGDGIFSFTSSTLTPGSFDLGTRAGSASRTFDELNPGTYDVAEAPIEGWDLASAACDNGNTPSAITVEPGDTVTCTFSNEAAAVAPEGGITIEKSTNGEDADTPTGPEVIVGDAITWTYVITNTGDVALSNVVVTDDKLGEICSFDRLVIDASETCTTSGIAELGQYANLGSVVGHYGYAGETATATDPSHYVGIAPATPGIDIEKATNGEDADDPAGPEITLGDAVTWTYVITNTGNVDLTNVVVTDDIVGAVCSFDLLAVGASETCEKTGEAILGQYRNVGTVVGSYLETPVTDKDPSHYIGVPVDAPAIRIVKDVSPTAITVGVATPVTWTIRVSNIGNVPLHDVVVTDKMVPACEMKIGDLVVGTSGYYQYTCDSMHTPENLAWKFTNIAVATGYGPDETEVTDTDPATVRPDTTVAGTAQLGDTVWWDANKNGVQDSGEKGINGARITLKDSSGTIVATVTTETGPWVGWYKFVGLEAGRYTVTIDTSSVDGKLTTPGSLTIDIEEGDDYLDADFGLYEEEKEEEELPNTGLDTTQLGIAGLLLLGLGLATLTATRKRSES